MDERVFLEDLVLMKEPAHQARAYRLAVVQSGEVCMCVCVLFLCVWLQD
jgi:hypothetical protein